MKYITAETSQRRLAHTRQSICGPTFWDTGRQSNFTTISNIRQTCLAGWCWDRSVFVMTG